MTTTKGLKYIHAMCKDPHAHFVSVKVKTGSTKNQAAFMKSSIRVIHFLITFLKAIRLSMAFKFSGRN